MASFIELGTGKTKYYNNILDFLEDTENGMQNIIADNVGSYIDHFKMSFTNSIETDIILEEFNDEVDIPNWAEDPIK